jgi:O-antigen/teichoic acid export membrane protein
MSHKRKILQGSASNLARVALSVVVSLVLPPLLVHRMNTDEYGAWVLILQIGGYINLLDLGLQTAIGKFVAEYDALGDKLAAARTLSSTFAILCASASVGAMAIGVIAWQVPRIFHQMPTHLIPGVRAGFLLIGWSMAFSLPFGAFLAAFTGLQRYGFPTALSISSKALSAAGLAGLLLIHSNLVEMALWLAIVNVATALGQLFGWRRFTRRSVGFAFQLVNRASVTRLIRYGAVLSIWSIAALLISGLDMVIVGHYDFKNTGYYGIATTVTNFMVVLIGSIFGPLLPAVSSLQVGRTAEEIGRMIVSSTRYCALLLCLIGLPLVLGAYPLLRLWVGQEYAVHSWLFLQVLILGNAIRQLGYPYSLAVIATGKQHLATLAAIAEAAVNITVSIYLVQRIGAVGVAIGTVVGALVSVAMHLTISIKLTSSAISISRRHFMWDGLLRPLLCSVPSMFFLSEWKDSLAATVGPWRILAWSGSTLCVAWLTALTRGERQTITRACSRLVYDLR